MVGGGGGKDGERKKGRDDGRFGGEVEWVAVDKE
jgi:hypothetical protein